MVSFDFEHEFDQNFSFDELDFESSSDHESLCDERISLFSPTPEVAGSEYDEDHLMTPELEIEGVDQEYSKSSSTPGPEVTTSSSDAEEVDMVAITIPVAEHVKTELLSPVTLAPPYRRYRKPVKPYPQEESGSDDDDSRASSYAPPSPSPKTKASPAKKSPRTSPKSSPKSQCRKRTSPVRGGEPRREQNMMAQKRYRDKKVQSAHIMLNNWLKLFALLPPVPGPARSAQSSLAQVIELSGLLIEEVGNVDPTMASKMNMARQGGEEE